MNDVFDSKKLELLDEANNFTDWLYSKYKHHISGNILEVSSGVGTYSKKILGDFFHNNLTLTEYSESDLNELKNHFNNPKISFKKLDLNNHNDFKKFNGELFDTILCSNVLEHIKNDEYALSQCFELLNKKGKMILVVPQNPKLYGMQDISLGHFRRYSKKEILIKIKKNGFIINSIQNFNFIGTLGWRMNKTTKKTENNPGLLKIFNKIIPITKFLDDNILSKITGLSLIIILEKN